MTESMVYDIVPTPGSDQSTALITLLQDNSKPYVFMKPGTYQISGSTDNGEFIFDIKNRRTIAGQTNTPLVLDGGGAVIVQTWTTTDDTTIAKTLMPGFRFVNCDELVVRNLTYDYQPRVYTQGIVTDVAATNF